MVGADLDLEIPETEEWDLGGGVKVTMRPVGPGMFTRIRFELLEVSRRILSGGEIIEGIGIDRLGMEMPEDEAGKAALQEFLYIIVAAQVGIKSWKGIADPCSVENIAIFLMSKNWAYDAFSKKFHAAYGKLISEGNASGPSPNGTLVEGQNTAEAAAT